MISITQLNDLADKHGWPEELVISRSDWAKLMSLINKEVGINWGSSDGPYLWIGGYLTKVRPASTNNEHVDLSNRSLWV